MKALLATTVMLLVLAAAACGGSANTQTGDSAGQPSPSASAAAWTRQAVGLGSFLWNFTYSAQSFTLEPKGDLTKAELLRQGGRLLLSAKVLAVDSATRTVTFDAVQTFVGAAALREERADGQHLASNIYHRNRFHHVQTLPVADGCAIVTREGVGPEPTRTGVQAVTLEELQANQRGALPGWYWLIVEASGVMGMLQQSYN